MRLFSSVLVMTALASWLPRSAAGQTLLVDDFEQSTLGWTVAGPGASLVVDTTDLVRHQMLQVDYVPGTSLVLSRSIPANVASTPNLVYQIEFWDDPAMDYGAGFFVTDASGRYVGVGVGTNCTDNSKYCVANGATRFVTDRARSKGWHKLQLYVTTRGTYAALDDQSLVYLRGQLYPVENATGFPIRTDLHQAATVSLEYQQWNHGGSKGWWDNFQVRAFRPGAMPTTLSKEEDLIVEFLGRHEPVLPKLAASQGTMGGIQNFDLVRLGLAAALGVRARRTGSAADWSQLETILTSVANSWAGQWSYAHTGTESAISAHALALLASWRWSTLPVALRQTVLTILASECDHIVSRVGAELPYGVSGNESYAERNAWLAALLGFVSDAMVGHPNRSTWASTARMLACNATTSASASFTCAHTKQNVLTPQYLFYHHNMVNPSYALTIPLEFAQANLFKLAKSQTPDVEYLQGVWNLVANSLLPIVRAESYLYRKHPLDTSTQGKLLQYTARDDWGQDATLQDPGWAYLERFFPASLPAAFKLDPVVTHAWLTRAGGALYPSPNPSTFALSPSTWAVSATMNCGDGSTCEIYQPSDSLYLFLNAMDALDRVVTLFMLDPATYALSPICIPSCTGKQCGDDGCGGSCGSCGQPPAASCVDASTLRHYSPGTCNAGQCSYTPLFTTCPNGCQSAACVNCTPSCSGKPCGSADGCGGTCKACVDLGLVDSGGSKDGAAVKDGAARDGAATDGTGRDGGVLSKSLDGGCGCKVGTELGLSGLVPIGLVAALVLVVSATGARRRKRTGY